MSAPTPAGPGHPDFQSVSGWSQQLAVINTTVPGGTQTSVYNAPMGNFSSLRVRMLASNDGCTVTIYSSVTLTGRTAPVFSTALLPNQTLDVTIPAVGPYVDVTAGAATPGSPTTLVGSVWGTNQPVTGVTFNGGPLLTQVEAQSVPASSVSGILKVPPFACLATFYLNPISGANLSNWNITCLNSDGTTGFRIYARDNGFGVDVTTLVLPIAPLVVQVSNQDTVAHSYDCSLIMRGY